MADTNEMKFNEGDSVLFFIDGDLQVGTISGPGECLSKESFWWVRSIDGEHRLLSEGDIFKLTGNLKDSARLLHLDHVFNLGILSALSELTTGAYDEGFAEGRASVFTDIGDRVVSCSSLGIGKTYEQGVLDGYNSFMPYVAKITNLNSAKLQDIFGFKSPSKLFSNLTPLEIMEKWDEYTQKESEKDEYLENLHKIIDVVGKDKILKELDAHYGD